jgi:hypothetical protein
MAVKDPKARRAAVHYNKGRVVGALGLLQYLFGNDDVAAGYQVRVDSRGRRRLSGLLNRTAAIGGKQIIIDTKDGQTYQLHYSGSLVDWALSGVPKLDASKVLSWSTARGKKRYI